jgi:hypothetical protein
MVMTSKRIWLGLFVTVVFTMLVGESVSLIDLAIHPLVQAVVLGFIGTALGAYVARRRFILPALGLWFVTSIAALYNTYRIAEPVGQASISGILQFNAPNIVLSIVAVAAGAVSGQYLARLHWHGHSAN